MPGRGMRLVILFGLTLVTASCGSHDGSSAPSSIARVWDEEILAAIRIDVPHPPAHARNLFHLSVAMYDAWAVYDPVATGYLTREKIAGLSEEEIGAARRAAITYAAYRVLVDHYALSANAPTSRAAFDARMAELGLDPTVTTDVGNSAAAVGNRVAAAVLAYGATDGSNQAGHYRDPTYQPVNPPLPVAIPGTVMNDPNRWQPLALDVFFTQNGIPQPMSVQTFLGSQWNGVTPFALVRAGGNDQPYLDPGAPPLLGGVGDGDFKSSALELIRRSSQLDPTSRVVIDISPGAIGNNPLGTNDGHGFDRNPVSGRPYPPQVVPQGDFGRVLAEFWADGPHSETPPGHWNVIANQISDSGLQTFQFRGRGRHLDRLEWDVKLYFALNAAVHDAAVQCWGTKRRYDYVRPISMIRFMGERGQSSDLSLPSYDAQGLPLEAGLVELVTDDTWPDGRHAGIECCTNLSGAPAPCVDSQGTRGIEVSCVGEIVVRSWPGEPADRATQRSGVRWVRAREWVPYQRKTFVTPAFAAYTSGHSTFSRAAAEVLAAFTDSPYFPGGLGEFVAKRDQFLTFEMGPSTDVRLQWATYFDAADQAGQSRLWGGIHVRSDDFGGRIAGAQIGRAAFAKATTFFSPP
ncbi:MAG: vanadium-dependent haloperoxidase [Deltaproteobacteria bacterium]|nr:vanadium-dependent haloperoxidase [Deltaproteobacteria bacterium]